MKNAYTDLLWNSDASKAKSLSADAALLWRVWGRESGKEFKTFEIKSCWAVSQFESDYNPVHWHTGNISAVTYTKIPNDFGSSYKKENLNGNIAFIHGNRQLTSASVYNVKPEIGDLFIFPSYMMHTVYPFFSNEERRSVSFNVYIDCLLYTSPSPRD